MKASFYRGNRTFETGTVPMPQPADGEALLRVRRVGICGTDLHIFQGHLDHRVPRGGIIGHETFAEVVTAPASSGFVEGDRVVVEPVQFCGTCRACRMGATYLCYNLKVLGVDVTGGMQEYWAVPAARLLKLPDAVSDHDAPLIEPLAVATHDVARAEVKPGDRVVVFGGGPIGTLIALVSRHRGAEVKVVEINPHRVEMLKRAGLDAVGPTDDVRAVVDGGPMAPAPTSPSKSAAALTRRRWSPKSFASGARSASSRSIPSRCRSISTRCSLESCACTAAASIRARRGRKRSGWQPAARCRWGRSSAGSSGSTTCSRGWRRRSAAGR